MRFANDPVRITDDSCSLKNFMMYANSESAQYPGCPRLYGCGEYEAEYPDEAQDFLLIDAGECPLRSIRQGVCQLLRSMQGSLSNLRR